MRVLLALLFVLSLSAHPVAAAAETPDRVLLTFSQAPSAAELAAAQRQGADLLAKAKAARRNVILRVAREPVLVLVLFESDALCDLDSGCPVLVFRDVTRPPVLNLRSFADVRVEYRKTGAVVLPHRRGAAEECPVPSTGKGRCRPRRQ